MRNPFVFYKHNNAIAAQPMIIPIHFVRDSFSLNKTEEAKIKINRFAPFRMGKKMMLFITPDRYRFIRFETAIKKPLKTVSQKTGEKIL